MRQLLRNFRDNQSGATSIEYGLIASLIFVVIVGAVTTLGARNQAVYEAVAAAISRAVDGPPAEGSDGEAEGG